MGKHILQLNFPTVYSDGVLVIDDISIYDSLLKKDCPTLQVQYPGAPEPVAIDVVPGFKAVLNACAIGLLPSTNCSDSCPCLPDGIYDIRYSLSPHDKVYVEYAHMRITQALNRWKGLLCSIDLQCCLPDSEMERQLRDLYVIKSYLDTSVAQVENCHDMADGMSLYRFACSLMSKMEYRKPHC